MPLGAQLNVHSRSRRSSLLRGKERNANSLAPQADLQLPSLTRQDAQVSLLAAPLVRQGAHADLHSPERKTDKNRKQDAAVSPGDASTRKLGSPKETRRRTKSSARSSKKFLSDPLSAWDEDKHHARMLACHTVSEMQRYYEQLIAMRPGQFKFAFEVQMKMVAKEKEATPMSPPRIKPAHYSVASAFVRQRRQAISDARRAKAQATATSSLTTSSTSTSTQPIASLSRAGSFSASNTLTTSASTLSRTPCTPSVTATTTTTIATPIVVITPCSPPKTPASPSLAPGSLSPLSPCSSLASAGSPSTPSLDSPTTPSSRAKISSRTIPARPQFASPTQTSSTTSSSSTTSCALPSTTLGDFASVPLSPRNLPSRPSPSSRAKISPNEHKKPSISSPRATKTPPAADGATRTTSFVATSSITPTSHSGTNASQKATLPLISHTLPRTFRTDRPALPQRPPPSRPRMPGREPPKRPPRLSAADVALPNTQPVILPDLSTQSASTTIHLNDAPSTHINNTLPNRGKRGVPELKLGQDLQTSSKSLDVRAAILPLSPSNRARKSSASHLCSSFATDKENDAATTPRAKQKK